MSLTIDDLKVLSAPFDAATVGIKVNSLSKAKDKALLVVYLQHTDVYARIEKVDPSWTAEVTGTETKGTAVFVRMKLTIKGVSRENAGEGDDMKSATSDAIKRAAMLFGVGRYLYDSEKVWVPYNEKTDYYRTFTFADYQNAIRPGQQKLPVGADQPPAPQSQAAPPKPAETTKPPTRTQLGAEIMKAGQALNLTQAQIEEWTHIDFNKTPKDLSISEMGEFIKTLQCEIGRKGEVA